MCRWRWKVVLACWSIYVESGAQPMSTWGRRYPLAQKGRKSGERSCQEGYTTELWWRIDSLVATQNSCEPGAGVVAKGQWSFCWVGRSLAQARACIDHMSFRVASDFLRRPFGYFYAGRLPDVYLGTNVQDYSLICGVGWQGCLFAERRSLDLS